MTEYVILVGVVALAAIAGYRRFGGSLRSTVENEGTKVALLESTSPGDVPGGGGGTGTGTGTGFGSVPVPDDGTHCTGDTCTRPGFCFVAGTPIATPRGLRSIETIEAGDEVLSRDEASGRVVVEHVVRTFVTASASLVDVSVEEGAGHIETIRATPVHPFFAVGRGWVEAGQLAVGDALVGAGEMPLHVAAVEPLAARDTVYNFEVEQTHSYFAGAVAAWVHNVCGAGAMGVDNFSYGTTPVTPASVAAADATLVQQGYQFVGWHGTSTGAAESMVNGSAPRPTDYGDPLWDGFYVGATPEMASGYAADPNTGAPGKIIRIYVPGSGIQGNVYTYPNDINDAKTDLNLPEPIKQGIGPFVIAGNDGTGQTEIVLSPAVADGAVVIPSLHGVDGNGRLDPNGAESHGPTSPAHPPGAGL